jgi:peptidoglycan-associated lipoprotein
MKGIPMSRRLSVVLMVAVGSVWSVGCKPAYPKCDNDTNCNTDGHKGVCIDGACQECGKDGDCASGFVCRSNKCVPKPECESDAQCPNPKVCRGEKCILECQQDGDCGPGQTCKDNRCNVKAECVKDVDCGGDRKCVSGTCQGPEACTLESVHFAYNEAILDEAAKGILQKNSDCRKSSKQTGALTIAGNCDERGTEEYNLHLGQRRADAAKKYLIELGTSKKAVKTVSYGKDKPTCTDSSESCWSQNRRDDFTQ